jgi:hypothetical protein
MIKIENEKNVHPILAKHARDFCEKIGAIDIYNIAYLGDGDYRIMYHIDKDGKIKMEAIILKTPKQ